MIILDSGRRYRATAGPLGYATYAFLAFSAISSTGLRSIRHSSRPRKMRQTHWRRSAQRMRRACAMRPLEGGTAQGAATFGSSEDAICWRMLQRGVQDRLIVEMAANMQMISHGWECAWR